MWQLLREIIKNIWLRIRIDQMLLREMTTTWRERGWRVKQYRWSADGLFVEIDATDDLIIKLDLTQEQPRGDQPQAAGEETE